jgi:L-amino acid N-acyltransferase YncA
MVVCVSWVNVSSVALHALLGFSSSVCCLKQGNKFGEWLRLLITQFALQGVSIRQMSTEIR